jgi:ADP-ribosylglycohydrolase
VQHECVRLDDEDAALRRGSPSLARERLLDQVYGCLIGGAIGDALGAAVENWHYADIRARYGKVREFLPQPARSRDGGAGQITDDSTLRHYLCLAIVEAGGRITPDDYARIWLERLNPDRLFVTERIAREKLALGMSPWDTGRGQLGADAAIMAIAPAGIINAADPRQAYQDGFVLAGIHQDGIERDAAATTAAGVAAAFVPDATADSVVAAMAAHATYQVRRLVDAGAELARDSSSVDELVATFYATMLDHTFPSPPGQPWDPQRSVAATSREVLPAVVALVLACNGDPQRALVEGASFGRDADTIASVIGCIVGALHGASALRPDWVADCEHANGDFFAEVDGDPMAGFSTMATRLVGALQSHRSTLRARLHTLDDLLGVP